jgi:hypothetical protein
LGGTQHQVVLPVGQGSCSGRQGLTLRMPLVIVEGFLPYLQSFLGGPSSLCPTAGQAINDFLAMPWAILLTDTGRVRGVFDGF